MDSKFNLIHITTGGEYKAPLVASQLFDQAESQAVDKSGFSPAQVQAWIIAPLRERFDNNSKKTLTVLRKRCPHIGILLFNGIDRLKRFPVSHLLFLKRLWSDKTPIIYHCRGEQAAIWAIELKKRFPQDKVVLDVRGFWPAELIYKYGIEEVKFATGTQRAEYDQANDYLKSIICQVDGISTVSNSLKSLLIDDLNAPENVIVVPCCVMQITGDEKRQNIRTKWGIKDDEIAIVYSGTTAAYQHLEDLTLPFMKKLSDNNPKIKLVILSPEIDKIKEMLLQAGIDTGRTVVENFPQNEVAGALTACDVGVLIRKPTLVNRVANPVKIAEYFASGLPLIAEEGVGGISDKLYSASLVKGVNLSDGYSSLDENVAKVDKWLSEGLAEKRKAIRQEVKEHFLWSVAIQTSRALYKSLLIK